MLKNLFNWGKGDKQAPESPPSTAGTMGATDNQTLIDAQTPIATESVERLNIDSLHDSDTAVPLCEEDMGTIQYSYTTLLGKKLKHYTEIRVDPGFLPRLTVSSKPRNTAYQSVRQEVLTQAYHGLKPYLDFVQNLKGIVGRDDLYRALELVMKRFLARYWDMPASKDHHHAYPWGFTLHSVEVACGEAEAATNWIPMSPYGIDEINHARHLGMVVFIHFVRGLLHDAHKLHQYEMTGYSENTKIVFDPIKREGKVLDFKLVYPNRTENWVSPADNPGKLNVLELLDVFPRELWGYAPRDQFFEVATFLFDMTPCASDQESAKRDASMAGRLTLEEMIFNAIRNYFTTEKSKTNPTSYVFRVNSEWSAVNGGQFFMKIRPVEGGVYTVDGVKACLASQKVLAVSGERTSVSVYYKVRHSSGKEIISKDKSKISFIRSAYLRDACPELDELLGTVVFDESDREQVQQLCPGTDNFIDDLALPKPAQPPFNEKQEEPELEESDQKGDGSKNAKGKPMASERTGVSQRNFLTVSEPVPAVPESRIVPTSPQKTSHSVKLKRKWEDQLRWRLENYDPAYSSSEDGWLFCAISTVYVRLPHFYKAMTNESLLEQPDWGHVAQNICENLAEANILILKPLSGTFDYIMPGGNDAKVTGDFFEIVLSTKDHGNLISAVSNSE